MIFGLYPDATCTYYVAPGGSDGAPGSEAQPWATFQHGADTAQPGETVCFRGGTYSVAEDIHLTQSGTAGAIITFVAYPGETPILDRGDISRSGLLILDQYTSYLRLSGFTLRRFAIWGLELSGENRHIQLDLSWPKNAIHARISRLAPITPLGNRSGRACTMGFTDVRPIPRIQG